MAIRVALNDAEEGGQYAFLKECSELNAGDRRAVRGAVPVMLSDAGLTYAGDHDDQRKNVLLARIITEWNLPHSLPKGDVSVFDKLTIEQLDRLYDAVEPHIEYLGKTHINPSKPGSDPTEGSSN